jgi:hypothetical protein
LVTLESSAIHEAIERPIAARALKAVGPADLSQCFLTLGLRSVKLQKLGHREPFLELNGIAAHSPDGICVPLYGLAGPVAELAA